MADASSPATALPLRPLLRRAQRLSRRARVRAQFVRPYTGPADGTTAQLLGVPRRQGRARRGRRAASRRPLRRRHPPDGRRARPLLAGFGDDPDTLVVVTSDHGEEFLEHGGVLHGRTQFQEVVRVPLIVRGPGSRRARSRRPSPSSTSCRRSSRPSARRRRGLDGADLAPTWRGGGAALGERYLSSEADHNNAEPDTIRAVRHRTHTLHVDPLRGTHQLFDLGTDPHEQIDIAAGASRRRRRAARAARTLPNAAGRLRRRCHAHARAGRAVEEPRLRSLIAGVVIARRRRRCRPRSSAEAGARRRRRARAPVVPAVAASFQRPT